MKQDGDVRRAPEVHVIVFNAYLYTLLTYLFNIYSLMILVYCVAGFLLGNTYARWYVFLSELVEPPLRWIRTVSRGRTVFGNIDISPMILIVLLQVAINLLGYLLPG